ncbi:MAG: hypothetical protein ACREUQ_09810 [Burkholderiales bacterium]
MTSDEEICRHDGLRLAKLPGPNPFLVLTRLSDGKELVSQPCVTTEPKDEIVRVLLADLARLRASVAALTAQVERVRAWTETAETDVSGPDVPRAFDEGKAEGYRECRDHVVALLAAPDAPGER